MSHKKSALETAGVEGTHELHIRTLRTPISDLKKTDFQKKEGHRLFEYLVKNLASGVYDALYEEMRKFKQM